MVNYRVLNTHLEVLKSQYEGEADKVPGGAPFVTGLEVGIAAAVGLLSLLQTETVITGASVSKEEVALVTEIARSFRKPCYGKIKADGDVGSCVEVVYPAVYFPNSLGKGDTKIIKDLKELNLQRGRTTAKLIELKKDEGKNKDKIQLIESLNAQVEAINRQLSIVNEKSGFSLLFSILRGEALATQFDPVPLKNQRQKQSQKQKKKK